MPSPYQEFVRKAKERYEQNKQKKLQAKGGIEFTAHARYKMSQYGLSEQKVRGVIRNPSRTEVGVAKETIAVMQPVSPKVVEGKTVWKQELWVMYILKKHQKGPKSKIPDGAKNLRIISTWRYPGVSPKRSPIPREIWQELEDGGIMEESY
jgi:hypothetical protein